jgi:anti-sigma factor ChrR (cupin superfamily)
MSPQLLALLQRIDRDTARNVARVRQAFGDDGSRFPRDYHRPAELVRIWHGPGARYFPLSAEDARTPSRNVVL